MLPLLLIAVPLLGVVALFSRARQGILERQAAEERRPLEQAFTQVPLINVTAPEGFVAPIAVTITDAAGRTFRVVIDEHGQQHPEPVLNLN
jgi:hypothetical protein